MTFRLYVMRSRTRRKYLYNLGIVKDLACNFLIASHICFRYWEFWILGGLEDFYNVLLNSQSPNLPAAKAIKVILMFIPVRSTAVG